MSKTSGISLIEIIMVVGITTLLVAIGVPVGLNFYLDYQLDSEAGLLSSLLKRSRNLSLINYNGAGHGLYLESEEFVVYQGSSYVTRNQAEDETYPRNTVISISGETESIFAALSGANAASSTYAVSDSRGMTRTIYVNPEGLVYE